jgi:D-glycero-D-manno-heptose 1,7-bisphosphate phosphatase
MARRFVILDRDGTIIVDKNYLADPEGVELIAGAAMGLRRLAQLGLGLIVVTNQSGIARRLFDWSAVQAIHQRMADLLAVEGVRLDGIYVCPHTAEDGCTCRKPRPGLVQQAALELAFEPRMSFVIGDKASDVALGAALGATTFLVRTGYGAEVESQGLVDPDHVVDDLEQAAEIIAEILAKGGKKKKRK